MAPESGDGSTSNHSEYFRAGRYRLSDVSVSSSSKLFRQGILN
jgi:hypothetical protein